MSNNTSLRPLGLYDYRSYLANERFAKALLKTIRWPHKIICPRCQSKKIWIMSDDYRCCGCNYHFSLTSGTIFAKTHLNISQWLIAVGLFKLGINALGLTWAIGCNYSTARRILDIIRTVVAEDPLLKQLSQEIEVDEAYYGGKRKGRRGRGAKGKTIVLGFKEKKRSTDKTKPKVKTIVIPNVNEDTLLKAINKHIAKGSTIYSDGFQGYNSLGCNGYQHLPFDHSVHFIKTDIIHTQGIESYWGVTKPITKARYRKITKKNMPKICAENDYRFNHSQNLDFIRLTLAQLLNFKKVSTL